MSDKKLDYELFIPKSGGVFARYWCEECDVQREIPYFMYQQGERTPCKKSPALVFGSIDFDITPQPREKENTEVPYDYFNNNTVKRQPPKVIENLDELRAKFPSQYAQCIKCSIYGTEYDSISLAAAANKVDRRTIRRWFVAKIESCFKVIK